MRYLLDTCSFLWLAEGNNQLSHQARATIAEWDNDGALSTVSLWELSMKSVVGKLPLPMSPAELGKLAILQGLNLLPLTLEHVGHFHSLPTHHRDPFDRVLAAIAAVEDRVILSPDTHFESLGVTRLW